MKPNCCQYLSERLSSEYDLQAMKHTYIKFGISFVKVAESFFVKITVDSIFVNALTLGWLPTFSCKISSSKQQNMALENPMECP